MGFASLEQVLQSASDLTFEQDLDIRRTKGLWHVFVILRAQVLRGYQPLYSFDLTEPCFDVLGVYLPIESQSRNVYFEPAATQGPSMFRHREGPRQTILNRIQSGSLSGGGSKPNLISVNQGGMPVEVSLVEGWISNLRGVPGNREILDDRTQDLITWLFRFGIPRLNGATASIGEHAGTGVIAQRVGTTLDPLPENLGDLVSVLQEFFGLTLSELNQLIPNLAGVLCDAWQSPLPVGLTELQQPLMTAFSMANAAPSLPEASTETVDDNEPAAVTEITQADYTVNWSALTDAVISRLAEIPILGLNEAAVQCIAALRAGKYVILLGPPGTGKTELSSIICEEAIDCGIPNFTVATATADWSTFETIGGYMPSPTNSGVLIFSENVFVESVRTGRWLIIDELNRADIDKAFGELFTLFSGNRVRLSYRVEGKPIVLVPPGEDVDVETEYPIYLLTNWRMLGTMNTFDKSSLFQMSYAFMRRFAFVDTRIPNRSEYDQLILATCTNLLIEPSCSTDLRDTTINRLESIFANDTAGSLRNIGLGVGPAIALDVIKYLNERYRIEAERQMQPDVSAIILESLEMFLFPQFEGRNELHDQILTAITGVLSLTSTQTARASGILATWTGALLEGSSA